MRFVEEDLIDGCVGGNKALGAKNGRGAPELASTTSYENPELRLRGIAAFRRYWGFFGGGAECGRQAGR